MQDTWIAIDFDKTIAEYSVFKGWNVCGEPIKGALSFLRALKELGYKIAVFSARAMDKEGKKAIQKWTQQFAPGLIDDVTHEKRPEFLIFIDDRAIHFGGANYKEVLKEILRRTKVGELDHGVSKETSWSS